MFILTGFLTIIKLCSRESSRFLLQVLESVTEADLEEVLERILDAVEKQPRESQHTEEGSDDDDDDDGGGGGDHRHINT